MPPAVSAKQVTRWLSVLVFVLGFLFTFVLTGVITYVGESPLFMWGLFILVGIWLWQLPALNDLDTRMTLLFLYALPFLGLWLLSNPTPASTDRIFVQLGLLLLIGIGAIFAATGAMAIYRKKGALRPLMSVLFGLFVCCWLVALFSASTGAASHWVQALVSLFHLSAGRAEDVAIFCRKCLHFLFYGTLGLLAWRAAVRGGAASRAVLLGLLFVLFHASFDEFRQLSFPDRTASVRDVVLDMLGGAVVIAAGATIKRRKPTRIPH